MERFFTGTRNFVGGAGLDDVGRDVLAFHRQAFADSSELQDLGLYRFRKRGEYHALNPPVFKALHKAVRTQSREAYERYAESVGSSAVEADVRESESPLVTIGRPSPTASATA